MPESHNWAPGAHIALLFSSSCYINCNRAYSFSQDELKNAWSGRYMVLKYCFAGSNAFLLQFVHLGSSQKVVSFASACTQDQIPFVAVEPVDCLRSSLPSLVKLCSSTKCLANNPSDIVLTMHAVIRSTVKIIQLPSYITDHGADIS